MMVRMSGLVKRGDVFIYRRMVPPRLRSIIGKREWKVSLGTGDLAVAQRRLPAIVAEVERELKEAEAGRKNPAVLAYRLTQEWKQLRAQRPATKHEGSEEDEEDAIDSHIIMLLERNNLDPGQRATLEALLKRRDGDEGADNPPLSILFERYYAERKLPPKTKLEWEGVCRRFCEIIGGDLPARAVTQAHVRHFKTTLLTVTSKRTGKAMAPATVQKWLNALRSVLSWGKSEGYLAVNPAEGITVSTKADPEDGRQPYSAEDLRTLFSRDACEARKDRSADTWLPWLALYTGARLEELGQLRVSDVREEEGVHYFAIEAGDGKKLKTRSSRRRIPIHPELIRLGFITFAEDQSKAGHERLFPELRATSYGSVTAAWSKYWGRHARSLGITDKRKTFHSFRHGWKDAARAVMPEEHHDAITGHANGSVGRSYGRGVPLKVLAESMARIHFPCARAMTLPR
jgi:integrase